MRSPCLKMDNTVQLLWIASKRRLRRSLPNIAAHAGYILTSEIDGTIQMKSYLTDNPEIRFALNEDLSIGRTGSSYSMSLDFPLTTSLGKL
ncbi:hypothetical protein ZEAMMB73_Zm00001d022171 [Zea mays]|uniref:MHD domain-containing protein n=1 Tax=Zea mays TaxID=4577 RepID=A0A1D6IJX2_MAIZE|nr:hypothetical protein ZEAMMB73_Zm00001d022171 [Zea mays]